MTSEIHTVDQERQSLSLHVDLCQQRYILLEKRLHIVEVKLDGVMDSLNRANHSVKTTIITSAATITAGLIGLITTILMKF